MSRAILRTKRAENLAHQAEIKQYIDDNEPEYDVHPETPTVPSGWTIGELLNVRTGGEEYIITRLGEEYDYRHPERAMKFTNYGQCQDFVSQWYARKWVDPRA